MKKVLFFLLLILSQQAISCTAFLLERKDFNLHGINMEWRYREGAFVIHPRNQLRTAKLYDSHFRPLIWKSTYGSIVLHAGNIDNYGQAADGMNEKGLVVSALVLDETRYDHSQDYLPALNSGMWTQYILDKFSSVKEVLADNESFIIEIESYRNIPLSLHLFITDAHGDIAILEYLDGKLAISRPTESGKKILANDPYQWSINKLAEYKEFGGEKLTPGTVDSFSRFIRTSVWIKHLPQFIAKEDSLAYSFALLGSVAQGPGETIPAQVSQVFDAKNLRLYWRSINESGIRHVDLKKINFDNYIIEQVFSPYTHRTGNVNQLDA